MITLITQVEAFMTKLEIKGDWKVASGRLKQEFATLTDDDVLFEKGKEEELLGRLQIKLGKTKDQVRSILDRFLSPGQ